MMTTTMTTRRRRVRRLKRSARSVRRKRRSNARSTGVVMKVKATDRSDSPADMTVVKNNVTVGAGMEKDETKAGMAGVSTRDNLAGMAVDKRVDMLRVEATEGTNMDNNRTADVKRADTEEVDAMEDEASIANSRLNSSRMEDATSHTAEEAVGMDRAVVMARSLTVVKNNHMAATAAVRVTARATEEVTRVGTETIPGMASGEDMVAEREDMEATAAVMEGTMEAVGGKRCKSLHL
jgi:hypothetical protein